MMVFKEEQELLEKLLKEWYEKIHLFTEGADGIFSERGQHLDRQSPPWMRHDFPEGYAHEIGKKIGRVKQFLECDPVPWEKVQDELLDILNYSRMMGAIIYMIQEREGVPCLPKSSSLSPPSPESQPGTDQDSTTAPSPAESVPTQRQRPQPLRRG